MSEVDEKAGWERAIESDGIIVGDDGSVRFTSKHRAELAQYFAMAGIDISTITNKEEYLAARRAAAPYFDEWLQRTIGSKEQTLERQLLMATLKGDDAEAARLKIRLRTESIQKKGPRKGG